MTQLPCDAALAHAGRLIDTALHDTSQQPVVRSFFDSATHTVSHVVREPHGPACAVIDSVLDFDAAAGRTGTTAAHALVDYIAREGLRVEWVLETHVHADHLSAAPWLQQRCGGMTAIGAQIVAVQRAFGSVFNAGLAFARDGSQFDRLFRDGDTFRIGALNATTLHVPGHTPACMAYVIGHAIFPGDTLFMPDYGTARCDFPGGDARLLHRSIRRLLSLPAEAQLHLCHDYLAPGRTAFAWQSTVDEQRRTNIHVHDGIDEDAFVAMRTQRDRALAMPRLMLPAVQVNMRAGQLPPAEDDGVRYLKIPVDVM